MSVQANNVIALWDNVLQRTNYETLLPKFPRDATESIRSLAAIARSCEECEQMREEALKSLTEDDSPELIYYAALTRAASLTGKPREAAVLSYMPLLEEALDAQRRCRVCGCTDYNACICGCGWVADDLCSECADKGGESIE